MTSYDQIQDETLVEVVGVVVDKFLKNIYLTGFAETWLKKFQVHFNNLTSKWNGKQLRVTSWG